MAESISVLPSNLILDTENPRLAKPNEGQREAQRAIGKTNPKKLLSLAKDIVEFGLSPSDLPIVMPAKGERNRYIVLEGNRRLAALRSLENPDSMVGALDPSAVNDLRKLSQRYQESPTDLVQCTLVKDRHEAHHWIELRHTGENQGAGVVPWAASETARFRARAGSSEIHLQALDFLEQKGMSHENRGKIPATSFKRLLGTPEVREKLGLSLEDGELKLTADEDRVVKALTYVAEKLTEKDGIKVKDIYTQEQRIAFADNLPKSIAVKSDQTARSLTDADAQRPAAKQNRKTKPKKAKPRDYLIPNDCVLNVTDARCGTAIAS